MRRSLVLGLVGMLMCAMVFSPAAAAPANGTVGNGTAGSCNEGNLNTALAAGGLITFNCGGPKTITLTSQKVIAVDTTLDGGGGITLTGNQTTRLFLVNANHALTLKHIVLDHGFSNTGNGGAILNHGTLTLEDATIQYSETDLSHSGGGIFSDGPVFITSSLLQFNNSGSGGALYANQAGARVSIAASEFSSNQAIDAGSANGGAIWAGPNAQVTLANSLLTFNMARHGGALYISAGAAVTVTGSPTVLTFYNNTAYIDGGAINNQAGGSLLSSGVLLQQNLATTGTTGVGQGGGIYTAGPLALYDTYFVSNAAQNGGGIYADGPGSGSVPVVLERTAFVDNFAQVRGGGLYLSGAGSRVTLRASLVDKNEAKTGSGGGIARLNAGLTVIDSSIISNTAKGGNGGGLWAFASGGSGTGGAVQVLDSTLAGNVAQSNTHGGGIYNQGAQVNLRNDTLTDNTNGIFNTVAGVVMSTTNSVFSNAGSLNCDDTGPSVTSLGGNYSSDMSCDFASTGDETVEGVNPLGPRTFNHLDAIQAIVFYLPKAGSSILNSALPVCSLHDQRGALRPDACDKGAVERGGLAWHIFMALLQR